MEDFTKLAYGYSTATNGTYVALGNPPAFSTSDLTGSVEVLKYCESKNEYLHYVTLRKHFLNNILISDEISSVAQNIIITENENDFLGLLAENEIPLMAEEDKNDALSVEDINQYLISYINNFGKSLALYGDLLVVGNPYQEIELTYTILSGSSVDVYDLAQNTSVSIYNYEDRGFGESVSICGDYIAVGSSTANSNKGGLYIFKATGSVYELLQSFTGSIVGEFFGGCVKFDQSGTYKLIVGNNNTSSADAYVSIYNHDTSSGLWNKSDTLVSDTSTPQTLAFLEGVVPYIIDNAGVTGFGNSVSIYGNYAVVGAPTDTIYLEYSGSENVKYRGATYIYQQCDDNRNWKLVLKSWGDDKTLKINKLGHSVDIYDGMIISSGIKRNFPFSGDYITKTINTTPDCHPDYTNISTLGQVVIYKLNSDQLTWDIVSTIQKKKQLSYPHTVFGYNVTCYDGTIVVGSPLLLASTSSIDTTNPNIKGYAYIYNDNNLIKDYHVGNVFYRNGKLILSNSGSTFDGLMKNEIQQNYPMYDISYTGKLTLFEKQVLCTIEPGEFNVSTNPTSMLDNTFISFKTVDYILKYINLKIHGNQCWWSYLEFTDVENSLFEMYTENYNLRYENALTKKTELEADFYKFDIDGNDKIDLADMYLIWKYYTNSLNETEIFKYVNSKSKRTTLSKIINYIEDNVIIAKYGEINPEFEKFDYYSALDKTGSYLSTYITTIGLYNGGDLIGVAKLGQPIKNSGEFPLNILVKWDF